MRITEVVAQLNANNERQWTGEELLLNAREEGYCWHCGLFEESVKQFGRDVWVRVKLNAAGVCRECV